MHEYKKGTLTNEALEALSEVSVRVVPGKIPEGPGILRGWFLRLAAKVHPSGIGRKPFLGFLSVMLD